MLKWQKEQCSVTLKNPKTTTSFFSMRAFAASTESMSSAGGPVFFFNQFTKSSAILPAVNSTGALSDPRKNFIVGKPDTTYFSASSFSTVASTLARRLSEPSAFNAFAAFAYSGANALQCPHHGASTHQRNSNSFVVSAPLLIMNDNEIPIVTTSLCTTLLLQKLMVNLSKLAHATECQLYKLVHNTNNK